jgi:tetratricopeptide (TPR) repeat protein
LVKRLPWLVVGWWWYLGVFVPAVGVFQVGTHARADRYTYLPLIGLFTIVSWSLASLVRRRPRLKRPVVGLSLAALACLMVAAGRQAAYWRDSKTLLSHGVRVDSRNFKAWVNLGVVHIRQRNYRGAERIFRQGVAALPNEPKLRYYLGRCLSVYQGRFAEGMAEMERALELDPAYREARVTLADVLAAQGNQQGALEQYHEVIRRSPKDPDGYLFLGKYWLSKGEYDKAAAQFRRACELRPDHPEAPKLLEQALSAAREPRPTQPVTVEAIQ